MADHIPDAPLEMGAKMDYSQHEKTYARFIMLAKYASLVCLALVVAMAFGFFTNAGFFSATILFFVITAAVGYLLRGLPTHIT